MFKISELPIQEIVTFTFVALAYIVAAIVGVLQLGKGGDRYKRLLVPIVGAALVLECVLLVLRGAEIRAFPLTGLFESMIFLTIVFGLSHLLFSVAIRQVWFGSVMVWVVCGMVLIAGIVATPAAEPHAAAATPWAIAHGIAMVLGGASITFATASACLYLVGVNRLKRKKTLHVLGRVPNIEMLERMTLWGLKAAFVLITMGLLSGLGLVWFLEAGFSVWVTDGKVVSIIAAWLLLGLILLFHQVSLLRARVRAYITIATFLLVLFAILGATILGATRHDFSSGTPGAHEVFRYV
ncbi:MAG: cytochrome c biogenesis protein CcsA [Phycisphaerales bacterium]|nr:MAG: cytochrome c biogenesis protein CcsA [Phycisphaerales bacterium]